MDRNAIFDKVKEYILMQLPVDASKVTDDARIKEDLGADSLDVLQLLMTIEEEHGIVIPDESLAEFVTVQDIVDYLESL